MEQLKVIHKCEYCGKRYRSVLPAILCEAVDEWKEALAYKGEYLTHKHGDLERIEEITKEYLEILGEEK